MALGAYQLFKDYEAKGRKRRPSISSSTSGSRSRSQPPHAKQHDRPLFEEILGAYSLGKDILGDRIHHVTHLIGEIFAAAGAWEEMREKEKAERHEHSDLNLICWHSNCG